MADKLTMALKAKIPLISVTTTDTINVKLVLEHLLGLEGSIGLPPALKSTTPAQSNKWYLMGATLEDSPESVYRATQTAKKCVVLVNTDIESPLIYDAGSLPTPEALIKDLLKEYTDDHADYLPYTGGLTLKDLKELILLTLARDDILSPRGLALSRSQFSPPMKGVEPVYADFDYYRVNPDLGKWLDVNTHFFKSLDEDERLTPRGLLLDGPPGTGKTMGAKYIAKTLGVPLYRLDLSGVMSKWLGDAESNLKRALNQIDQEAPCVMLIDEVEKAFNSSGEHETTGRILGYLLWWLQEHRTRVLTVMTTNHKKSLPPEVYRPGRVDAAINMPPMNCSDANEFAKNVLDTFGLLDGLEKDVLGEIDEIFPMGKNSLNPKEQWAHADVTEVVHQKIKEHSKKYI